MKMLIGSAWVDASSERTMDVVNPATWERIDSVPLGGPEDGGAAVEAAGEALAGWAGQTPLDRGKVLYRTADLVRREADTLATTLVAEQGKPLREAKDEVRGFAHILEYYAGLASSLQGETLNTAAYGRIIVEKRPLGVCVGIVPWNMPVLIAGWKIGPALLAGNTVVLKPASTTPLTTLAIGDLFSRAGLPAGALNIVTGPGETLGEALVTHPDVRKVSFTGEIGTGRRVAEAAAQTMKYVTLELGGSDPMIVCDDADLEAAVAGAVAGRFYNCGQTCTAVKRLFVFSGVAEKFRALLTSKAEEIRVGNGMEPGVRMGPLNNAAGQERMRQVVEGIEGEGRVLTGGKVPSGKGFFFEPTVVTGLAPDALPLRDEVFGPVLPVFEVESLDEALHAANSTKYGLGASIWTKSLERAERGCRDLEAGIVWVNQHLKIPPEAPFGGTKWSGIGRENGRGALDRYTEERSILIRT
ncbi:MAG: aldehyde dehydrogenase family protein [Methanofollis sp.]|uniref:aldehyde dehydrogenase family protein n=1 Tax=Methanofollis sp. TaxID=2052835 RepID=UPI00260F75F5|nr:aldehyde dehydrogenase family protein [Methanofollis sp.]MDD4254257.1 aldehyde dehydrogenase family protein [Methanofollis sp.]